MAIYANLRDYHFSEEVDDIRGSAIYGVDDEKLGKIDDVIFDSNSGELRYLVVDTGGWLKSHRFIIPARQVRVAPDRNGKDHYYVSLTKEQIKKFPPYDEKLLERDEHWDDYERRYEAAWSMGPVLHQEDSTRVITPSADEVPSTGAGIKMKRGRPEDLTPRRIGRDMPRFGAMSSSETDSVGDVIREPTLDQDFTGERSVEPDEEPRDFDREPGEGIMDSGRAPVTGRSFEQFQQRLRRERESIVRHCRNRRAA